MEGVEEGSDRAVQSKKKDSSKRQKKRLKTPKESDAQIVNQDDEAKAGKSDWAMKTVSGADLVSKVISVSQDSKHLMVASGIRFWSTLLLLAI